ncbi:MAG: dTDP-4-dehydrorhamnose 3,5-epimerase [Chloroflexota bacterium]|nr:dTDP-4-dehydrorhamnose 3,5-epimerase [Chloroflexota bacterium]
MQQIDGETTTMARIRPFEAIHGVQVAELKVWADERGQFIETFRKEWFPQREWERVQTNRSDSRADVLRGLHYHLHQVDYWYVPRGAIRVGLADLRPSSPTYKQSAAIELGEDKPRGLFIPVGVAHGFVALTDATLIYLVDNYYDSTDEHGVRWDDPQLHVPWDIETPILSPRDQQNPPLAEIPAEELP